MTERQLQFRVGLFVVLAMLAGSAMLFQFSSLKSVWKERYPLVIRFEHASGVHETTAVRRGGIPIGEVTDVRFDEQSGDVLVTVEIDQRHHLREDARPQLVRSLLGDASIEFTAGQKQKLLRPGSVLSGESPADPMEVVDRLEEQVNRSLAGFDTTSREWQQVAANLNQLMETNNGNLAVVVERAAESLQEMTIAMRKANVALSSANLVLTDTKNMQNLQLTLDALPKMANETRQVIVAIRKAVETADGSLAAIRDVTSPLAERSESMAVRLENTLANMESLSGELSTFTKIVNHRDGSLQRFVSDPTLYRNLSQTSATLAVLVQNLQPILRDVRIFSDKVARHPELIGVSGALRGSAGIKEVPDDQQQTQKPQTGPVQPVSREVPRRATSQQPRLFNPPRR
ncbi:MAG: MCE family protein [Planctomycetaceae bacterium]|nr:MCE family protein [Planctomycetaceae bacterium]